MVASLVEIWFNVCDKSYLRAVSSNALASSSCLEAISFYQYFHEFQILHFFSEGNQVTDRLASLGLHSFTRNWWHSVPGFIFYLVGRDLVLRPFYCFKWFYFIFFHNRIFTLFFFLVFFPDRFQGELVVMLCWFCLFVLINLLFLGLIVMGW